MENLRPKCIIDVGAGLQQIYSELLGKYHELNIYGFEPHPQLHDKIVSSVKPELHHRLYMSRSAVSHYSQPDVTYHLMNDPCCSSMLPLNFECVDQWKYPFNRKKLRITETISVPSITLNDFLKSTFNKVYQSIDLLFIDVQGCPLYVLRGISTDCFKSIKRIIVKVIVAEVELYTGQSNTSDVLDLLRDNGFVLIRNVNYSLNQEQYFELVNSQCYKDNINTNAWFKIHTDGTFALNIDVI